MSWTRVAIGAALVGLVAWSCWQRWGVLAASPFPIGVDGYFYPIEVRSLLEHGTLQYPASPLTFWWMAPFAAATDPITGAKLGAALGGALIAVPAYGVGARLGKGPGAGLVAASLATTSASSAYLSIEFVKQGIGLTVALAALWLVLGAVETRTRGRAIAAGVGVLAALLAHKMAAGIVIAIAVPALVVELRARGALRGRRRLYVLLAASGLGLGVLGLGLLAPQRFLSTTDLALLGRLVTGHARWDAPALVTQNLTLSFDHDAAVAGVLGLVALVVLLVPRWVTPPRAEESAAARRGVRALLARVARPVRRAVAALRVERSAAEGLTAWAFVGLAVAIALPWLAVDDPQGLAFRLRVAAFVPMAMAAAIVAAALQWMPRRELALAVLALVIVLRTPPERTEGRVLSHPALVAAVMAATDQVPAGATLIVPERHIAFMAAWYTRAPISLRPEPVPYARRVRLMPLAWIAAGSPLDDALDRARQDPTVAPPIGLHPRHRNGLVLVTEPTWDWLLAHLPPRARAHWGAWPTI